MLSRLLLLIVGLSTGFLIGEISLRYLEKINKPVMIQDKVLGTMHAPKTGGHDAKGYRNENIPPKAEIVALGDSQTWGVNAGPADTWPKQLQNFSGKFVYNMGVSGFGPVHYYYQLNEALKFQPRIIILGLFLGNDLADAYSMIYSSKAADKKFFNPKLPAEYRDVDTIAHAANKQWSDAENFITIQYQKNIGIWAAWLEQNSAIIRLLNRSIHWPVDQEVSTYCAHKAWALAFPDQAVVYERDGYGTICKTRYPLVGINTEDPRVLEGLRITKEVITSINQTLQQNRIKLLVVFIPLKASVYYELIKKNHAPGESVFHNVVHLESEIKNNIIGMLNENGIMYTDTLPDLVTAASRNEKIYPMSHNGHPTSAGYRVIAVNIYRTLLAGNFF